MAVFGVATVFEPGAEVHAEEMVVEAGTAEAIIRAFLPKFQEASSEPDEEFEKPDAVYAAYVKPNLVMGRVIWYRGADWDVVVELTELDTPDQNLPHKNGG